MAALSVDRRVAHGLAFEQMSFVFPLPIVIEVPFGAGSTLGG